MVALLVGEPVLRYFASPHFVTPAPIYALTPFRLDALAAGALFALVLPGLKAAHAKHAKLAGQISIAVGILLLVALTAHYPWFRRMSNAPAYNALIYSLNILVLGGLFLWAWFSRGPLTRVLSHPVLGWLGRISYMFYLSHLFFLYYAGRLLLAAHVHSHVVAVALAFAGTCAFSTLSWTAVEKPILSLGRAKHPGKLAKAEATANAQAAA
jgi:peptidoglycan/LPS O-acetylase OafA/YrhL